MKYYILAITLLVSAASFGQTETAEASKKIPTTAQILSNHYGMTYQAGIRYNDYSIAKHALYNILVEYPKNDSILYSLSLLYFQTQQYASAALTAKDVMVLNPENIGALEIAAVSFENIGALDKALESYESLYLKTDDFNSLYKMAFIQFDLKKYVESKINVDILLSKKEADELKTTFTASDKTEKEYLIKIPLINLKGLITEAEGNKPAAKVFFEQALKLAPDFELAKQNLARVNK
jgi:tetratricopeptide (TPR) repeat protein